MKPQPITDIRVRAELFLKEKKNITHLKPFATPKQIQERYKNQLKQKDDRLNQIRVKHQSKQKSIQQIWNNMNGNNQPIYTPLNYADPRVRLNQISTFQNSMQNTIKKLSQQQIEKQKNLLNSKVIEQNLDNKKNLNQELVQNQNSVLVEANQKQVNQNVEKNLFKVHSQNATQKNDKKQEILLQQKPKNIFSGINTSNSINIFAKSNQNKVQSSTNKPLNIFQKKIQSQPVAEHKIIQSSNSQKLHSTDKIQTTTPGNIFEQKKQTNLPNIFSNNQTPSLFQNNQAPSLFQKNQAPSLFQNNQVPSLFSNNQASNLLSKDQTPNLLPKDQTPSLLPKDQTPSLLPKDPTPNLFATNSQPAQSLFKNNQTSNLFANNPVISIQTSHNPLVDKQHISDKCFQPTQKFIQKQNEQNKKQQNLIFNCQKAKEQIKQVQKINDKEAQEFEKRKKVYEIASKQPSIFKTKQINSSSKETLPSNAFSQPFTSNSLFSQKATNNQTQPLVASTNIFSKPNTISLFGNNNNITKTSTQNNITQGKPQEGLFGSAKPNLFAFNSNKTGSSLFGQTNMFSKPNSQTNMFSAPKNKEGDEQEQHEDQEGDDDEILQAKDQIDPALSTGNYKYTQTQVFFKENVAKFKIDNGNLFESVGVSIEQVGQASQKLIFVRLPNKILLFYGMPLKGKTEIRKMSDKSIVINGCVRCDQEKKSMVVIKMNFKQADHCNRFFEIVNSVIRGQ